MVTNSPNGSTIRYEYINGSYNAIRKNEDAEDVVYETNIRVVIIEFQLVVIPVPEEEFTRRQNGHKRYSQKY